VREYGKENLPEPGTIYKTKSKNAQEAHEAIRPTSINNNLENLKTTLDNDQWKLYSLIWKRTLACQMVPALIDTVAVDLLCGTEKNIFRANGSSIANPGFILVYQESFDDVEADNDEKMLPSLQK